MNEKRIVERSLKDNQWEIIDFMNLKKSDRFRLRESTGELVENGKIYIADGDAFWDKNETGTIFVNIEEEI